MSVILPINSALLRQRMLELAVSDRLLGREIGIGQTAVRSMTRDGFINGSLTLAAFAALLRFTGLTAGQLLDPVPVIDHAGPPSCDSHVADTVEDDIAVLAHMLLSDLRAHPEHRLATAACWSLDRLRDVLTVLDERLAPVGLRVHRVSQGAALRAADDRGTVAQQRLALARDLQQGLDNPALRLLYLVYIGRSSRTDTRATAWARLRNLHARGLIRSGKTTTSRITLTDAAAYAFDVP